MIRTTDDEPTIDQARMAALLAVMGQERVGQLLHLLLDRLDTLGADIAGRDPDWRIQQAALHQNRGSASSLGLMALAASLNRLEAAIDQASAAKDGPEVSADAIANALAELARLQAQVKTVAARFLSGLMDNHIDDDGGALNL